ncbi:hypothetical protein QKU48_gp1062 [Fadolivirus algeromassiliense]|jgi:hypothetical protein|uniref:Uncharacterized protein n=1 Tax=Fadolivirus FV1/VV64 TaxID=3070911 RepID=A0A7D3QXI7_9VIRU|nr:hypothetical protein QKU48_gp1062 [Fadolivirus algeromassiliense]QKF94520.1 hypothetical protein Fadolivirus_1_1062 [Fadolivirus FV1/VV64]
MTKAEILYPSHNKNIPQKFIVSLYLNPNITMNDINKYYMKIYELDIPNNINIDNEESLHKYLEELFSLFNSEQNPLSTTDLQEKIKINKLHTSMSMGDVVKIMNNYYFVSGFGFKKIIN